jgi:hypothetical protein
MRAMPAKKSSIHNSTEAGRIKIKGYGAGHMGPDHRSLSCNSCRVRVGKRVTESRIRCADEPDSEQSVGAARVEVCRICARWRRADNGHAGANTPRCGEAQEMLTLRAAPDDARAQHRFS